MGVHLLPEPCQEDFLRVPGGWLRLRLVDLELALVCSKSFGDFLLGREPKQGKTTPLQCLINLHKSYERMKREP